MVTTPRPAGGQPGVALDTWRVGLLDGLLDDDGLPPCRDADSCPTCRLFGSQHPGESRQDWLRRIAR